MGLGFRDQGFDLRVQDVRSRGLGLGSRIQGFELKAEGLECRV